MPSGGRILTVVIVIFLLTSILSGCSEPGYAGFIEDRMNGSFPNFRERFDTIVIIPRIGCNSCTRDADKYYRIHKESCRILFIFTTLQSKKLLRIENGPDIESRSNVYLDENRTFCPSGYEESQYPVILTYDNTGQHLTSEYLLEGKRLLELE